MTHMFKDNQYTGDHTYALWGPNIINNLPPEAFQLILHNFAKENRCHKLVLLRRVSQYWKANIDSYLASRRSLRCIGQLVNGSPPPRINHYEFDAMLSHHPNIRYLVVKNFTITDVFVAIIRDKCPDIEKLSLYGCHNLSWKGITILAEGLSRITFLDVSNCGLDENCLSILTTGLQNLKTFNAIKSGPNVTGQYLSRFGPKIDDIWIGLNYQPVPNQALEALVSGHGRNLNHLGLIIRDYQAINWRLITNNMQKLKSLRLTFCSYGNGSLRPLGQLKELEFLVLLEDSRDINASVLTDYSFIPMIEGCAKLKYIAMAGTKTETCRLTHGSIALIPKYCPRMEQIRFLNANEILNETLVELASLSNLRVLHLNSMAKITDKGIIDFVKITKNKLRNFRVGDCPQITEAVIEPLIEVAKLRPNEKIRVYLEVVQVTRSLEGLPNNLKLDIKEIPLNNQ